MFLHICLWSQGYWLPILLRITSSGIISAIWMRTTKVRSFYSYWIHFYQIWIHLALFGSITISLHSNMCLALLIWIQHCTKVNNNYTCTNWVVVTRVYCFHYSEYHLPRMVLTLIMSSQKMTFKKPENNEPCIINNVSRL